MKNFTVGWVAGIGTMMAIAKLYMKAQDKRIAYWAEQASDYGTGKEE